MPTPPRSPRPRRRFGQNFLVDAGAVDRIIELLDVRPGEAVIEIGPGRGVLTRALLDRDARVTAIEMDGVLVEYDMGDLVFDDQIEIEPSVWWKPFSLGGDSGSLLVDGNQRALALLFGGNDADTTYATPIREVLDALRVDMVL